MKDLLSAVRHSVKDEALLSSPDNQLICEINRHIDYLKISLAKNCFQMNISGIKPVF